jgi:hypothetical protein
MMLLVIDPLLVTPELADVRHPCEPNTTCGFVRDLDQADVPPARGGKPFAETRQGVVHQPQLQLARPDI